MAFQKDAEICFSSGLLPLRPQDAKQLGLTGWLHKTSADAAHPFLHLMTGKWKLTALPSDYSAALQGSLSARSATYQHQLHSSRHRARS